MTKREKILIIWCTIMTWGHIVYNRFLIENNIAIIRNLHVALREFIQSFT